MVKVTRFILALSPLALGAFLASVSPEVLSYSDAFSVTGSETYSNATCTAYGNCNDLNYALSKISNPYCMDPGVCEECENSNLLYEGCLGVGEMDCTYLGPVVCGEIEEGTCTGTSCLGKQSKDPAEFCTNGRDCITH